MTLNTMRDLLIHELQDLYSAEQQLIKALPTMISAATEPMLATAFREHLGQTEKQLLRLEKCFKALGQTPKAIKCKAMEGLIKEGADMAEEDGNPMVRDAGLIGAAQRVEHYEIAAYGTCVELATVLGEDEVAELLSETLEEESDTNDKLTELAESEVNPKAMLSSEKVGVN